MKLRFRDFGLRVVALWCLSLILLALLALHGVIAEHGGRADAVSHAACCDAVAKWEAVR